MIDPPLMEISDPSAKKTESGFSDFKNSNSTPYKVLNSTSI
jgi:hypothetical protein